MSRFLWVILALCLYTKVIGQVRYPVCGTRGYLQEKILERLIAHQSSLELDDGNSLQIREIINVPIFFHLVAKSDGTGRISEDNLIQQLCALNADYASIDIQFFLKDGGVNYINNNTVFSSHASAQNVMSNNFKPGAINVFILQDANLNGESEGYVLGYYDSINDWLVVRKDELGASTSTLSHEMGHFFSLVHTHRGWDSEPWSLEKHGNPAPATSPGGVLTEKQNGSSCKSAGDLICDTPPDYNGFGWINCNYTAGAKDPNGDLIDPDESNFMGYFLECDREDYHFSDMQKAIMVKDLDSREREYLRVNNLSFAGGSIESALTLNLPTPGQEIGYKDVLLSWNPVPAAKYYLLELDNVANFQFKPIRLIVTSSEIVLDSLSANRNYYWRVKPFNDTYGCASFSTTRSFKTTLAVGTQEPEWVSGFSIWPLPVSTQSTLHMEFNSLQHLSGEISIAAASGQELHFFGTFEFVQGQNTLNLTLPGSLPGGYYVLIIRSRLGIVQLSLILR